MQAPSAALARRSVSSGAPEASTWRPIASRRDHIAPARAPPPHRHRRHRPCVRRRGQAASPDRRSGTARGTRRRLAACAIAARSPASREHRVHDRRMAGSDHPPRLVGERGVDLRRDVAGVGGLRQAVGFGDRRTAPCARHRCAAPPRPASGRISAASARASSDLPVPDSPPTATSLGGGGASSLPASAK